MDEHIILKIVKNGEIHYEAYKISTMKFVVSGDTRPECENNLMEVLIENAVNEIVKFELLQAV